MSNHHDTPPWAASPREDGVPRLLLAIAAADSRGLLAKAFGQHERVVVCGVCDDAGAALRLTAELDPHVVVCDLALEPAGAKVVAQLRNASPRTRVVALTSGPYAPSWFEAFRLGAEGVIPAPTSAADARVVAGQIIGILDGAIVLGEPLGAILLGHLRDPPVINVGGLMPIQGILTNREWEIVELMAQGATTREIAERLVLTEETIYTHVKNVLRKLGVHTRGDAVDAAVALREDVVRDSEPASERP